jgi:hypothetical protein
MDGHAIGPPRRAGLHGRDLDGTCRHRRPEEAEPLQVVVGGFERVWCG